MIKSVLASIPAAQTAYTQAPTWDPGFRGAVSSVLMTTTAGASVIVSFDGQNDHLILTSRAGAQSFATQRDYQKVWARAPIGAPAPLSLQLVTETDEE